MNAKAFRIIGLHTKIEKLNKSSSKLKILSGACLFFSLCYCYGTKSIENIDKGQALLTNIVWITSIIILVVLYIKDSACAKNIKLTEFEIYRLEVEDINIKKDIARITGKELPDYELNKQIDMPNEKISLPIIYYSILLGLNIIMRISLIGIYRCKEPYSFQHAAQRNANGHRGKLEFVR